MNDKGNGSEGKLIRFNIIDDIEFDSIATTTTFIILLKKIGIVNQAIALPHCHMFMNCFRALLEASFLAQMCVAHLQFGCKCNAPRQNG